MTYKKNRLPTSQQEGKNLLFLRLKKITIICYPCYVCSLDMNNE